MKNLETFDSDDIDITDPNASHHVYSQGQVVGSIHQHCRSWTTEHIHAKIAGNDKKSEI